MAIRDRFIDIVGGARLRQERAEMREALDRVYNAYELGKFRLPPDKLLDQLGEYGFNSNTVADLIRQRSGAGGYYYSDPEQSRIYQQQESRQQWLYSPLAQWAVNTWTSYGMGESITVTCNDEKAQEYWVDTWEQSRILADDEIHNLSRWTLVDGEIYLVAFHSVADGSTIFEQLETDEIKEIISDPGNKNNRLYYKREYIDTDMQTKTVYYPDYHTFFYHREDLQKAKLPAAAVVMVSEAMDDGRGTSTTVLHIPHNRKLAASLHGWPILGLAAPYLNAHKNFMQDRATVSMQKASFSRELITQGGSRANNSVAARFQSGLSSTSGYTDSNPPAIAGSSLVHNAAVEYKDLPMTTGAGDANTDNNMFAWMAGIGVGLFPTTMGLDTSRWATAVAMDKTQAVQWACYQSFWACQFEKMVKITLLAAEQWGGQSFEDKGCKVSIDTLSLVDFPGVVQPISQMLNAINGLVTDGTIPQQAAREIVQAYVMPTLTALGTENVDEILSDEIMGILDEEQREKVEKQQAGMVELARQIYNDRKIAEKVENK